MPLNQTDTSEEPTPNPLESDESTSEDTILEIGKQKISWQRIVLILFAGISVIIVILIFIFILVNGLQVIPEIGLIKFLFGTSWNPEGDQYGILHGIIGTVMVVLIAMVVAVPISISCSIYISEIAPPTVRKVLKPSVEMLASIPCISRIS